MWAEISTIVEITLPYQAQLSDVLYLSIYNSRKYITLLGGVVVEGQRVTIYNSRNYITLLGEISNVFIAA